MASDENYPASYELHGVGDDKTAKFTSKENGNLSDGLPLGEWTDLPEEVRQGFTQNDQKDMIRMGKKQEFRVKLSVARSGLFD